MNALPATQSNLGIVPLVRWAARLSSLASLGLLTWFLFSGGAAPTVNEGIAMALFPGGVMLGMLLGWWREGLGGLLTVASLAGFYAWMAIVGGRASGPYFLLFAAPGFLFLAAWLMGRLRTGR